MPTESAEPELKNQAERSAGGGLPKRRRFGRAWRWFWIGDEIAAARQASRLPDANASRRARIAAEIARRVAESPEPFGEGTLGPICELYRQSIHWSLLALAAARQGDSLAPAEQGSPWGSVDSAVLLKAVGDPAKLASAKHVVDSLTFHEVGILPLAEQGIPESLRQITLALLAEIDLPQRVMDALLIKRAFRLGLLLAVAVLAVAGIAWGRDARERGRDLAVNKPWRTSSVYAAAGCVSPKQECADGSDYFFHTQEEQSPWIEFDLGSSQRISGIRVVNRKDCCGERAAPILVEVSTDQRRWKAVARRETVFSSWLAEFAPVDARWVRLRLENRESLHLAQVRILH